MHKEPQYHPDMDPKPKPLSREEYSKLLKELDAEWPLAEAAWDGLESLNQKTIDIGEDIDVARKSRDIQDLVYRLGKFIDQSRECLAYYNTIGRISRKRLLLENGYVDKKGVVVPSSINPDFFDFSRRWLDIVAERVELVKNQEETASKVRNTLIANFSDSAHEQQ